MEALKIIANHVSSISHLIDGCDDSICELIIEKGSIDITGYGVHIGDTRGNYLGTAVKLFVEDMGTEDEQTYVGYIDKDGVNVKINTYELGEVEILAICIVLDDILN